MTPARVMGWSLAVILGSVAVAGAVTAAALLYALALAVFS